MTRNVVVTGIGMTTPIGGDAASTWAAALAGTPGTIRLGPDWAADQPAQIAAMMKVRQVLDDEDVPLTQRETQVLRHVALGLSNREIGRSLEISVETVKEHVQNILRKIAVSDRTQAAVWAVRKGLV